MAGTNWLDAMLAGLDPDGTIRKRGSNKAGVNPPPSSSPRPVTGGADPVERARKWIAGGPPSISNAGGHNRALEVAQALVNGFELSPAVALDLMRNDFNPRCEPAWSERELEHKVEEAVSKPNNKPRGWLLNAQRDPRPSAPHASGGAVGQPSPVPGPSPGPSSVPSAPLGLPRIVQQPAQLRDVVDQALAAMVKANDPIATFVHGDVLVQIDTTQQNATVKGLSKSQLRLLLSGSANWINMTFTKDGDEVPRDAYPKSEVVESIQDHRGWPGMPRLTAVADVPVITAESGLLTKPGYDAPSGVYLLPGGYADVPHVNEAPSCNEMDDARDLLMNELLGDFPFADEASKANMLALFLLPFVRGLIDGPTPLHHIDAPQEGTGKSLLAEVWGHVAFGRDLPSFGEVSRPDDWQKLLLAALIEAPREIFLDNINGTLDSGTFASALTSPAVSGRLLGFSRIVKAPVRCVWVSSGNNVRMSKELVRRTVYIRIDSKRETAWSGRKYRHSLPTWAKVNRGKLVWACLTLCQGWIAAGKPRGRELFGKFEAWSAVIDGILCNAAIGDLLGNQQGFRDVTAESGDEWRPFVNAWWEVHGSSKVTAGDLARLAEDKEMLVELLERATSDKSRSTLLGKELKKVRDRTYRNLRIQFAGKNHREQALYCLVNLEPDAQEQESLDIASDVGGL